VSTFWIHKDGSVAVGDAVLTGIDVSSLPSNIQLMWWYGDKGEILYNDRLPVREPVPDLEAFVPIFNKWILAAKNPTLKTTSGKQAPAITLAQAKAVKSDLVWGLYHQKANVGAYDNTASVNASIQALVTSTNDALGGLAGSVNGASTALNTSLSDQATGHNANVSIASGNFGALSGFTITIPSGGGSGSLPLLGGEGGIGVPSMPSVSAGSVSAPGVDPGGTTDPMAPIRNTHLSNINAQTSVDGVAAYDITAGW